MKLSASYNFDVLVPTLVAIITSLMGLGIREILLYITLPLLALKVSMLVGGFLVSLVLLDKFPWDNFKDKE